MLQGTSGWAWRALAFCATVAAGICPPSAGVLSFDAPSVYLGGGSGVVVADFNGDGKLDLAATGPALEVFLGKGDGSFQTTPVFSFSFNGSASLAVGDFNGDGKPDLVVTTRYAAYIFLGNGDGTFQNPRKVFVGGTPYSIAVADFNGDGKQDLAVGNHEQGTVSILAGNGDGTFGPAVIFPAGPGPNSVAVGDFNHDGKLDLAVANTGLDSKQGAISILLGTGTGSFQAPVNYGSGDYESIVVGDFNGDGKPDLAAVKSSLTSGAAAILLGNGDGTFREPVGYQVYGVPDSLAIGDFNGDGKPDLAIDGGTILLGNGDGTFQHAPQRFWASTGFLAVGDFNGDGKQDLAVTTAFPSPEVQILLGRGRMPASTHPLYFLSLRPCAVSLAVR